ncbi:MAG: hypothetical protein A2939_02740 [Parcubacteria group bacterium RIFCSPLOWO2_01_FULL_48_18]|nr:MAG: hypothetical protein A2939_02740 [Parcubacteria group bacterium RIFCSPLOWO2_01_FULL_48_18]OHB23003.1 MAG: hypothetical protein A3J67_03875 [Parcubacteria group bacterium RIFCSPHIGHO2_02_FULL_48_10b]
MFVNKKYVLFIAVLCVGALAGGVIFMFRQETVAPVTQETRGGDDSLEEFALQASTSVVVLSPPRDTGLHSVSPAAAKEEAAKAESEMKPDDDKRYCFERVALGLPIEKTDWRPHRNYVSGFELMRPSGIQIDREVEQEEPGKEVFRVISPLYASGTLLKAFDLRLKKYEVWISDSEKVTYDGLLNVWQIEGQGDIAEIENCVPGIAEKTAGDWPIFTVDRGTDTMFWRTHAVLHPFIEEAKDRFPIMLEFSVNAGYSVMDAAARTSFEEFIRGVETMVRSIRFFVPQ